MILSEQDIALIIKNNPNKHELDIARKKANLLNIHITGDNFKSKIEIIDEFEDDQKKNLRQTYSRSNKDIFERLHRPIDKIFSAKGGSTIYNMPDMAKNSFQEYLNTIINHDSLRTFIRQIALPAFQIDPMGLIFMETKPGAPTITPYPTYKSTSCIYDYKCDGRYLDYVIFNVTVDELQEYMYAVTLDQTVLFQSPEEIGKTLDLNVATSTNASAGGNNRTEYYRVVDDVNDYLVQRKGDVVQILKQFILPQPFVDIYGKPKVPAILLSDIVKYNSKCWLSPDENVVELANDILTDNSVFSIFKKRHGFPKSWRIQSVCPTCKGTGTLQGDECPECNGSKFATKSSVRDDLLVPPPTKDSPPIPANLGGYIVPPIDAWGKMTEEIERLYFLMFETLWGTLPQKPETSSGEAQTATAKFIDTQAMYDTLKRYSRWAETLESFIIDMCGKLMYGQIYKGVSNNYGDRYLVESPDVLEAKYKDAKTISAPQALLDGLLRDYYESRYEGSPVDLQRNLKLMKVEPFQHYSAQQVSMMTLTRLDKVSKSYFDEWLSTQDDMKIISTDAKVLVQEMLDWMQTKLDIINAEEAALRAAQPTVGADDPDSPVIQTESEHVG